jgi:hypothetical protein
MIKFNKLLLASFALMLISSCTVEDDTDPEPAESKSLVGTWEFTNIFVFGQNVAGDGSYLQFEICDATECAGVDYKASDASSSTFTYTLYGEDSINFVDNDPSTGGNYNGTWIINSFTDVDLELEKDFGAFGIQVIEMKKQ